MGPRRSARGAQRPGLRRTRPADRDLPDRRASRVRADDRALDDATPASTTSRPMRSATSSASIARRDPAARPREAADDRLALRHGAQRAAATTAGSASSCRSRASRRCAAAGAACRSRSRSSAFAEEEGQRYKATFLGSRAVIGRFDPAWLDQTDADGVTMRDAMRARGPAGDRARRSTRSRATRPDYLGFVEVHIEQGPVLDTARPAARHRHVDQRQPALPVRGDRRREPRGHDADGQPPRRGRRRRRARAVPRGGARRRCPTWSARSASLEVPGGSTNVVPGRCRFSLDIRATTDPVRDACADDVLDALSRDLRAPRPRVRRRGDDARRRVPERARTGRRAGRPRSTRSDCRSIGCRAAPATTR